MPTRTQNLLDALTILILCDTVKTHHAAEHLVAAEALLEYPKPVLDAKGEAL